MHNKKKKRKKSIICEVARLSTRAHVNSSWQNLPKPPNPPNALTVLHSPTLGISGHNARRRFRPRRRRLRVRRRSSRSFLAGGPSPRGLSPPPRTQAANRSRRHLVGPRQLPPRLVLRSIIRRWLRRRRSRWEGVGGEA
jgi:hypothetical protein